MNFWPKLLSLPSWERGLKLGLYRVLVLRDVSLPSWERGLKQLSPLCCEYEIIVAPFVGAWIET